ncbi:hypothetical protein NG796_04675 [Laspinema sp. A4]|uniref:hypothetical protein n=1 Tax=Laspinema sp. D2d TaxID=2953686 RepID=UPI0021BACA5B|nr:hypothetical protein [Laspinema sp. D2d]MCT7982581.1 hypothetical protein [Laspinema sp. D2d]
MQVPTLYSTSLIAEVFGQAWNAGFLTITEREGLMAALLENTLNCEDYAAIDRLLHAVRRGWIKVTE